jgi:hypothetical protein
LFKIRVAGLFCVAEEAKVFQHAMLAAAEVAWHDAVPTGRLLIGCDPAGDGDGGDESGFCARRGLKVTQLRARAGMSPEAHIAEIQDIIAAEQLPTELKRGPRRPVVIIESEGEAGWKVFVKLREHAERTAEFDVVRVRTSQRATRQPLIYKTTRDEVWASAREWMREGGAIPESVKLARDLHAPEFKSGAKGLLQVTPKKDLRKLLGRSPDIGDAFVLCCWEPLSIRDTGKDKPAAPPRETGTVHDEIDEPSHDPYGGGDWSRGWRVAA